MGISPSQATGPAPIIGDQIATVPSAVTTIGRSELSNGDWTVTTLNCNDLRIPITDNGTTGSGGVQILDWPQGYIEIASIVVDGAVQQVGISAYNSSAVVFSLGTATASADATLTGTEANLLPSTSVTLSSGAGVLDAFAGAPADITAFTDNSGGTAADTLAAISGTYSQAEVRNSVASLAAKVNALVARINGTVSSRIINGSSTAPDLFFNAAANVDPATSAGSVNFTGFITVRWRNHGDL